MRIPETTATAPGRQPLCAVNRQVLQKLTGAHFKDLGPDRHADDHVFAIMAGAIGTFAVQSTAGNMFGVVTEMK